MNGHYTHLSCGIAAEESLSVTDLLTCHVIVRTAKHLTPVGSVHHIMKGQVYPITLQGRAQTIIQDTRIQTVLEPQFAGLIHHCINHLVEHLTLVYICLLHMLLQMSYGTGHTTHPRHGEGIGEQHGTLTHQMHSRHTYHRIYGNYLRQYV